MHRRIAELRPFRGTPDSRWQGYTVTVVAIVVMTLVLSAVRTRLGLPTIGLLYLLAVVLVATRWGWGPGLLASILANLAFNFFFVPPLYTFTVQEPANALALAVFLVVASLSSALLARAQAGESAARRREQEVTTLYDLSRLMLGEVELLPILASVCERVRTTFAARSCAVLLPREGDPQPVAWSGPTDAGVTTMDERRAAEQAMTSGKTVALGARPGRRLPRVIGLTGRPAPVVYVPLRVGGRVNGVLRVAGNLQAQLFTEDELRLLEAFADVAAPAIERDRLLREAAQARALQEADQLKSALLAAVSHDLRTPLTTILASASSLLDAEVDWDPETRRQFLVEIERQAERLNRLVGNLLDLSRIEGGVLRADRNWYDVDEFLQTTVAGLGPIAEHHHVLLDVAPNVGVAPFDEVQLAQVVTNLVENAAKFAPPQTEIRITARRRDREIEISVADQGPGIPPAERERVFDRFYRVHGTAAQVRGTGLGLAICKGLVEANGGRILADEAEGGGARFIVALPAPPAPATALAAHDGAVE